MRRKPRVNEPSDQLADLQSRSDQSRIDFLRTELTACSTFAGLAETERTIGNEEHAKRAIADAEKGYATLDRFLTDPKHAKHLSDEERQELTEGMEQIRRRLDAFLRSETR